ncbi:MAG: glucosidase [Synechococcales cyanobacterium]
MMTAEHQRLAQSRDPELPWKRWGPYLSERQWGTVREDYSPDGTAWEFFPHDHARSRTYRWGEDGILGISDDQQRLCFALTLWNGADPILKERLFGLTGNQGNHGEDVKEYYFYLDNTPTHTYMKGLYKYPQAAFPYNDLVQENERRLGSPQRGGLEYELVDTGVFAENRYFDLEVEYAKAAPDDILIRITIHNRSTDPHPIHLLPTLWFRNTWSWDPQAVKPTLHAVKDDVTDYRTVVIEHDTLGAYWFYAQSAEKLLFTDNETNLETLYGLANPSPYVKDGFHRYLIHGEATAVNHEQGTKMAAYYVQQIAGGSHHCIELRLSQTEQTQPFGDEFQQVFRARHQDADEFYRAICPPSLTEDQQRIQRQALAGMLWTKQYFLYSVETWLKGDAVGSPPPAARLRGRNREWLHLDAQEIISMPDKWEYPWFAAWDLAFHAIPLTLVDPEFAKHQLDIMTREWYMHPNGQIPAYEWKFSDVNPPVHAWATWRVYKLEQQLFGRRDRQFLERVFQKLLMNFTWWVNRKDVQGNNVFEGGFLGLDNIGVFDRSSPLPTGGHIEQADGTSWMAMYCLDMLTIALELALDNPVYEDIATKFFEHFIYIADAMNKVGPEGNHLWDEGDGFFYDVLNYPDGHSQALKVRSMVGLIPLFATMALEADLLEKLSGFRERMDWFMANRPELTHDNIADLEIEGIHHRRLLSVVPLDKLHRILSVMLDEEEFLSDFGIRALSRYHRDHPYVFRVNDDEYRVTYLPAESDSGLFGGNSNWRGPIWMPVNYLLLESLLRFYDYFGDECTFECPTGSGQFTHLKGIAAELSRRLVSIFARDPVTQRRPVYGDHHLFQTDPHWRDLILFYEYFHGDNGAGIGASHQTGWTGVVAELLLHTGANFCDFHAREC